MSMVELPSRDGKIIAVNPHRVSGVQSYSGYMQDADGKVVGNKQDMSVVWVNNHTLYVCIWPPTVTLDALNEGKHRDAAAFTAGYLAAQAGGFVSDSEIAEAFHTWMGLEDEA